MNFLKKKILSNSNVAAVDSEGKDVFGWEPNENILNCRECDSVFTVINRRHHCRLCGSIFCEDCNCYAVKDERACLGCARNETPGPDIRNIIQLKMKTNKDYDTNAGDYLRLTFNRDIAPDTTLPASGFFEFVNKSEEMISIKVLTKGDFINETHRPSYIPIPPFESVYFPRFDCETIGHLIIIILIDNPNPTVMDSKLRYKTRGPHVVSECANTLNFKNFLVFKITCLDKNVSIKYKGSNNVEPRHNKNIVKRGIKFLNLDNAKEEFKNNIDETQIQQVFSSIPF
jgi:hypothetical protein